MNLNPGCTKPEPQPWMRQTLNPKPWMHQTLNPKPTQ